MAQRPVLGGCWETPNSGVRFDRERVGIDGWFHGERMTLHSPLVEANWDCVIFSNSQLVNLRRWRLWSQLCQVAVLILPACAPEIQTLNMCM